MSWENAGDVENFLLELELDWNSIEMKKEYSTDTEAGTTGKGLELSRKTVGVQKGLDLKGAPLKEKGHPRMLSLTLKIVILFDGAIWLLRNCEAESDSGGKSAHSKAAA